MKLSFYGGAGTVTGSKSLLEINESKILVDCGLFQGIKEQRLLNWQRPDFDPARVDAVILTHAHLDHSGYLPLLIRHGFRKKIYCTRATADLVKIVLLDAAKIQEEDAERSNVHGYSKHHPALPLYTVQDAEAVFSYLEPVEVDAWLRVADQISFRLSPNGHILGSVFVEIKDSKNTITFSGDLGRKQPLVMKPSRHWEGSEFLVVEGTYGDRCHPRGDPSLQMADLVVNTEKRGGHLLIPAFAIGRIQDILCVLSRLKREHKIPDVPIYLDSPMADRVTALSPIYPEWTKLEKSEIDAIMHSFTHVTDSRQSRSLANSRVPSIVIAGSGMLTGGRIHSHLVTRLPHPENTILLTGFQAAGTLGRFLREGATEVKIMGKYISVAAQIAEMSTLSAHADQSDILDWIDGAGQRPKKIVIVHAEAHAAEGLRVRLTDRIGVVPHIAKLGETLDL